MVTFEELAARYPTRSVPPFGDCVVVPGAEFDPDWEALLCDLGCAVNFTDLDSRPVTLVRRKAASKAGGKVVYHPPSPVPAHVPPPLTGLRKTAPSKQVSRNGPVAGYSWTEGETALLVGLWNKKLKTKEIVQRVTHSFPGRTETAVKVRIAALARKGVIRPRWKCRKRGAEPSAETKSTKSTGLPIALPTEKRTEVRIEASTEAHIDVCTDERGPKITVTVTAQLSNVEQLLALVKGLQEGRASG